MTKQKLTDSTQGPVRRPLTIVALVAVVISLLMMVAVVLSAFNVLPGSWVGTFIAIWVLTLVIIFAITRYLRPDPAEKNPRQGL